MFELCTKYGSYPIHRRSVCHEAAIRILLHSIAAHAARYKRIIEPLLSVSMDFYIRVFVRVRTSAAGVKLNPSRLSYVYYSASCDSIHLVPVGRVVDRSGRKVVARVASDGFHLLDAPPQRLNARDTPVPYHPNLWEAHYDLGLTRRRRSSR